MTTIIGDILEPNISESELVLVCHQVNCKGVMGGGLAKQIKDKYPGVFQNYADKCRQITVGIGGLGDVQYVSVIADAGYIVANIFGQDGFGRDKCYTDYDALNKAFENIAMGFPNAIIRIPYLFGCGLAGGNWDIVTGIIEDKLVSKGIKVEIWKLPSIAKAEEEARQKAMFEQMTIL